MEPRTRPGTYDPDLDLQPRGPSLRSFESIEDFQRLVANPFLAVLSWLTVFAMIRQALRMANLYLFLAGTSLMFLTFLLLQFHCLDCGKTGWLRRARKHACPPVVARWQSQESRRFRGPSLGTQLQLWFCLLAAAFILIMILRTRH